MKRNAYGFRDERFFKLRLYALHDCRMTLMPFFVSPRIHSKSCLFIFFVSRLLQEICSAPVYDPFHIVRSIFFCDIVASKKRTYFFKPRLKPWLCIPRTFFPLFQQIQTAFQVSEQKFNHGGVINIIGIFRLSPLPCKFCISIFQRFKLYQFPGILQSRSCHTCNFCAKPFPTFIFYIITYSFPSVVKRNGFVQVIGIFKQKADACVAIRTLSGKR